MDENIKSEEQRPSTKYRGNKESFGLFSSIGRLFSKLLNRLKNKIIDFLAVNPMPMEFPEMGKKAAKAPRKRPVGLFTIIGLVGKTVRILLNVTYKYGIRPKYNRQSLSYLEENPIQTHRKYRVRIRVMRYVR